MLLWFSNMGQETIKIHRSQFKGSLGNSECGWANVLWPLNRLQQDIVFLASQRQTIRLLACHRTPNVLKLNIGWNLEEFSHLSRCFDEGIRKVVSRFSFRIFSWVRNKNISHKNRVQRKNALLAALQVIFATLNLVTTPTSEKIHSRVWRTTIRGEIFSRKYPHGQRTIS